MDQIKNDTPTIIDLSNKVARLTLHGESYEQRIHELEDRLGEVYEILTEHKELIKALSDKTARQAVRKLKTKKTYSKKEIKKAVSLSLKKWGADNRLLDLIFNDISKNLDQ